MTDRDALLAAITANPEEDTPRLVYADWLDEHDEPDRAEFIRIQCRLEHLSRKSAEGKPLARREKELQSQLFGSFIGLDYTSVTFRRGFVGTITTNLRVLPDRLTDLLLIEDAPAYELKVLPEDDESEMYDDGSIEEAFEEDGLRRCVSLDLPCLGIDGSLIVFQSKHLVNLRRLNFPSNEAGPSVERVASPTFANLRWANFRDSDSAFDYPSIVPLAECPHLANLEYLDFAYCSQPTEGARAVAATSHWKRLRHLNLTSSAFSLESVAELFASRNLPALTELCLSDTFGEYPGHGAPGGGDPFCAAIADSPVFAQLTRLRLGRNGITDAGAKALAASPRDVKLTFLDLAGNDLTDDGMHALRARFGNDVCVFESAEGDDD